MAFLLEIGDGLGGVRIEFLDLAIPVDGLGGLAFGMIDLAEDVAGEVAVLAFAIGHHAGGGEGLDVLFLPEQSERGHVLETGREFAVGVAFGEFAAEIDDARVVLEVEHAVAQAEAGVVGQRIGRIEGEEGDQHVRRCA